MGVLDQPFFAAGNVATADGWLSAQYLAAALIARTAGEAAAKAASVTWRPSARRTSTSPGHCATSLRSWRRDDASPAAYNWELS